MKHLVVSLAGNSWGRTSMARTIAQELAESGEDVVFLFHESLSMLMRDAAFRCERMPVHMEPLAGLLFEELLRRCRPDSVILGDYFTNANFLQEMGIGPEMLLLKDAEVFTLDVWDCEQAGYEVDIFTGHSRQLGPGKRDELERQFRSIPHKLRPVPVLRPTTLKGGFCNLPSKKALTADERRRARHAAGMGDTVKAVFFCTADVAARAIQRLGRSS